MRSATEINRLLDEAVGAYVFSGYQLHAEHAGSPEPLSLAGGITSYWGRPQKVRADTRFDIGSITKALVTTSLAALAVDQGLLRLDERLGESLTELEGTPLARLLVADVLAHASGLAAWYPFFRAVAPEGFFGWLRGGGGRECLPLKPGERAEYSDIGFLLLGHLLDRRLAGLSDAFQKRVARPLGLKGAAYWPVPSENTAATEFCLWRQRVLQGEVFDENAAALGQPAGHAGVFAPAAALAPWCREWLKAVRGESDWLGQKTAALFTRPSGRAPKSSWALGWDMPSPEGSSAGTLFSRKSFGHLGFPGCSVWIDPEARGFVLFFSNRIHPSRVDERIRALRPRLHDAVARYWKGS